MPGQDSMEIWRITWKTEFQQRSYPLLCLTETHTAWTSSRPVNETLVDEKSYSRLASHSPVLTVKRLCMRSRNTPMCWWVSSCGYSSVPSCAVWYRELNQRGVYMEDRWISVDNWGQQPLPVAGNSSCGGMGQYSNNLNPLSRWFYVKYIDCIM